jgi:predicted ATP-dependent serine protease
LAAVGCLMSSRFFDCLNCGMHVPRDIGLCPKCDDRVAVQTDGAIITADIAHQQERVVDAMAKLHQLFAAAEAQRAARLRIIVGSGLIREAVLEELHARQFRGEIGSYTVEGRNHGALLVNMR